jgi:Tol biopolymer transport system component/DNA-binding winged helix-turn-helix (wHTH) protein
MTGIFRSIHASAALEVTKAVKYLFDSFTLDTDKMVLIEGSERRHLTPKKFEILSMLVTNAGRLLTKSEILEQVWPNQIVEEGNLATHIHSIRQLLRDDPRNPRIIMTVQGFGYRFQPEVTVVTDWVEPPVLPAIPDQSGAAPRRAFPRLLVPGLLAVFLVAVTIGSLLLTRFRAPASPAAPIPMQLTAYPGIEQYPTLSPDGSMIAYTWDGGNSHNRDLYIQQTDGSRQVRVTAHPGVDRQPVWSPDGKQLAFLRVGEPIGTPDHLIIVPALGGQERELARVIGGLDWSPDGQHLVITGLAGTGGGMGLFLISIDGSVRRQITSPNQEKSFFDSNPRFSPDGGSVAFLRSVGTEENQIFILDLQNSQIRQLTNGRYFIQPGSIRWNPNGTGIFFISQQAGPRQLWQVGLTEGNPTPFPSLPISMTSFSTDRSGTLLAYTNEVIDTRIEVYDLSRKTDQPCVLNSTRYEGSPQFSPDGSQLVFISDRTGWDEIFVASADCTKERQLTTFRELGVGSPRWSPDGTRIVFDRRNKGESDIYSIDLNGAHTVKVGDSVGHNFLPFWSPDGEWIYFSSNRAHPRIASQTWKVSRSGGQASLVTPLGIISRTVPVVSPDGRFLYHNRSSRLAQLELATGTESEIVEMARVYTDRNWDIGRQAIYFFHYESGPAPTIERLDLQTRRITKLATLVETTANGLASLSVAKDERRLAVSRPYVGLSDVMLIKHWR